MWLEFCSLNLFTRIPYLYTLKVNKYAKKVCDHPLFLSMHMLKQWENGDYVWVKEYDLQVERDDEEDGETCGSVDVASNVFIIEGDVPPSTSSREIGSHFTL